MYIKDKIQIVNKLKDKLLSNCFYIIDASGLKVEEINKFRKECFKKKISYQVVKNTLIKKTLKELNNINIDLKFLKGFSGILITNNLNSNQPAKIIKSFRDLDSIKKIKLKIAFIEESLFIGNESLEKLIKIKSKNEMIYDIILLLKFSIGEIINSLNNEKNKIFSIIEGLKKKK